ncbi:30S ribosomal protein S6 [Methylacidiphilum sp. Yel]|jgi:small subunit ribosomal protein S6|uniref:30S ribosomal protein S6 n=1 Tax=Methylacidiphilum sp. Yel TaxID=1847730 RepID=UPI00106C3C40|nr:30S ribosomal protein S6 [Methylacidiphilum sp. Yel]TFE70411.1 30S ribosomal protein S6 [Methylacidiphilum sp. Yel]
MNRTYDALYILDIQGKEEAIKELIEQIEKTITTLGGKILNIQKMDRRKFERVAGKIDSGYYVNFRFEIPPLSLKELEAKLRMNPSIYRQFYVKREPSRTTIQKNHVETLLS